MSSLPDVPPLRWLLGNGEQRRIARLYWIRDPLVGALELTIHFGMRLFPIDVCSHSGAILTYLTRRFYPKSDARARKA